MNMFSVKKYAAYFVMSFMPAMAFFISLLYLDYFTAVGMFFAFMALAIVVGTIMVSHPMMQMIEGKGMLTMTWDSTGVIESFLVRADAPFVRGIFRKKLKETMFDREIVNYLIPPQEGKMVEASMLNAEGKIVGKRKVLLMPTQQEKPDYLFSFGSYPCFIFNKSLDNFMQKSLLSNFESNTFVKHMVLHLLKKTEDLSMHVRDFARYIVESTRPKKGWFAGNRWIIWLIIAAAVITMVALFVPALLETISGGVGGLPIPGPVNP